MDEEIQSAVWIFNIIFQRYWVQVSILALAAVRSKAVVQLLLNGC